MGGSGRLGTSSPRGGAGPATASAHHPWPHCRRSAQRWHELAVANVGQPPFWPQGRAAAAAPIQPGPARGALARPVLAPSPYPLTPNLNLTLPLPYPALKALRERRGPRLPRRAPATRRVAAARALRRAACCHGKRRAAAHGAPPSAAASARPLAPSSCGRKPLQDKGDMCVVREWSGVGNTVRARSKHV